MNLILNNPPILESDGDAIRNCLMDLAYIFGSIPGQSLQSHCNQANLIWL